MITFYCYSVNHQSGLQRNTFSKLSYIFNISKCAANYVISFEVYDGFIGQNFLTVCEIFFKLKFSKSILNIRTLDVFGKFLLISPKILKL